MFKEDSYYIQKYPSLYSLYEQKGARQNMNWESLTYLENENISKEI